MKMKWYEEVLLMIAAIASNTTVTVTSQWGSPILIALTAMIVRCAWTLLIFWGLRKFYAFVKKIL